MSNPVEDNTETAPPARRAWMAVLAKAAPAELDAALAALPSRPSYVYLRRPETGLVMLRGRIGGNGTPFNLGEATMTRCALTLAPRQTNGFGYVLGRSARHAELSALFDALMIEGDPAAAAMVADLGMRQAARAQTDIGRAAATNVEFFTMVRE